jgi:hypothetical protein
MGEVYAAEDTRLHRRIALKVLPRVLAADPERRLRFERDAQVIRYTLTFGVMGGGGLGFGARGLRFCNQGAQSRYSARTRTPCARAIFPTKRGGIAIAIAALMARRHPLLRATLMLLPLVASTARLHAHSADTPIAVTQELNRCLTMVRIAATRRPTAQAIKKGSSAQPGTRSLYIETTDPACSAA